MATQADKCDDSCEVPVCDCCDKAITKETDNVGPCEDQYYCCGNDTMCRDCGVWDDVTDMWVCPECDERCNKCGEATHELHTHPFGCVSLCQNCTDKYDEDGEKQCPENLHGKDSTDRCEGCYPIDEDEAVKERDLDTVFTNVKVLERSVFFECLSDSTPEECERKRVALKLDEYRRRGPNLVQFYNTKDEPVEDDEDKEDDAWQELYHTCPFDAFIGSHEHLQQFKGFTYYETFGGGPQGGYIAKGAGDASAQIVYAVERTWGTPFTATYMTGKVLHVKGEDCRKVVRIMAI